MLTGIQQRQREEEIAQARSNGLTWKMIGEKHGISSAWAKTLAVRRDLRVAREARNASLPQPSWMDQLTIRARHCLMAESLRSEDEVRQFVVSNGRSALLEIPNMGPRGANEVLKALGLPSIKRKRKRASESQIKGAITLLNRSGYRVEKVVV